MTLLEELIVYSVDLIEPQFFGTKYKYRVTLKAVGFSTTEISVTMYQPPTVGEKWEFQMKKVE